MTPRLGGARTWRGGAAALLAAMALGSCAYYNTFYKAKDYYSKATAGAPYPVEKPEPTAIVNFNKSIEYSKKLLAVYPRSKWVDDAYLLWARSLMGKDDPLETMNMLRDFPTRYPQSALKDEALFYLGAAGRKARKYTEALAALDDFLARNPDHDLAPYAWLERARVLVAVDRASEGAEAASRMLEKFPKHRERDRAMLMRAEAWLAGGDHERARADYRLLGTRAATDAERFDFLLKEADCLEAARLYDGEVALLQEAMGHETEPQPPVVGVPQQVLSSNPASVERWGRLMIRIGTAHALSGRKDQALQAYRRVVEGFPRTQLAAEAQFRIGYTHETIADDFETARKEYALVQTQAPASQFTAQAVQRLATLDRLSQYRSGSGADSASKQVEAAFLLAEQYLFQLDKPDRAVEQYQEIVRAHEGTPHAAKALNAEAWVLRNKLGRSAESDSLLWTVVRRYPKTEAQVDARDYLERYGHRVPPELIQLPEPVRVVPDTTALARPPERVDSLGVRRFPAAMDSLLRLGLIRAGDAPVYGNPADREPGSPRRAGAPDSAAAAAPDSAAAAAPDSAAAAAPDSSRAPLAGPPASGDSLRVPAPDTLSRPQAPAARDTVERR